MATAGIRDEGGLPLVLPAAAKNRTVFAGASNGRESAHRCRGVLHRMLRFGIHLYPDDKSLPPLRACAFRLRVYLDCGYSDLPVLLVRCAAQRRYGMVLSAPGRRFF